MKPVIVNKELTNIINGLLDSADNTGCGGDDEDPTAILLTVVDESYIDRLRTWKDKLTEKAMVVLPDTIDFWFDNVGEQVSVTARPNDFFHNFDGIIVSINMIHGLIDVKDQDDNVFSVYPTQIEL